MHFQKKDLEGTHYNWADPNKHLFTGEPSRRIFDRFNGYQVLFLINSYVSRLESLTPGEGKIIEHKIQHDLPQTPISEISVFNWMRNTLFAAK